MDSPSRRSRYDLVSFANPPVAEVALSAQFAADTVDLEALGLFAHRVRPDLPVRQQQPVVARMVETFDTLPLPAEIEIRFDSPMTLPRTWFLSEDGVQLVQLQHDRLTLNWRELDQTVEYPRYEELRERFAALLATLDDCVREAGGTAAIDLCEVTYVNPVEHPGDESGHPDLSKLVNRLRARPRGAFLPDAEDTQLHARWRIPAEEIGITGRPTGRLYLAALPGLKPPKNTPIYMINLTGRVIPSSDDSAGALEALDVAHRWVVLGFTDVTTPQMHRLWGMKEASS